MNKLFLIAGPSGVGKTTIVEWVLSRCHGCVFLQKVVTRPLRAGEQEGLEVVTVPPSEFADLKSKGEIVAAYCKYETSYGLFRRTRRHPVGYHGAKCLIHGLDQLTRSPGITVGDAYESPRTAREVYADTVIIVLHAEMTCVLQRVCQKKLSDEERSIRLATVSTEFDRGFPRNVPLYDYLVLNEGPVESAGEEVLGIIEHESAQRDPTVVDGREPYDVADPH
jgi:guanylate kinase